MNNSFCIIFIFFIRFIYCNLKKKSRKNSQLPPERFQNYPNFKAESRSSHTFLARFTLCFSGYEILLGTHHLSLLLSACQSLNSITLSRTVCCFSLICGSIPMLKPNVKCLAGYNFKISSYWHHSFVFSDNFWNHIVIILRE